MRCVAAVPAGRLLSAAASAGSAPLHLAVADVAADKVLAVAQEDAVAHGVDVGRQEVGNARVAGVLAVVGDRLPHQVVAHLRALGGQQASLALRKVGVPAMLQQPGGVSELDRELHSSSPHKARS